MGFNIAYHFNSLHYGSILQYLGGRQKCKGKYWIHTKSEDLDQLDNLQRPSQEDVGNFLYGIPLRCSSKTET